ncbi:MAG: hypothetical protein ACR2I8_01080, partial [Steroidobacteraceae bacterium]
MRGPRASVRVALPWWHDALAEARSSASLPPLAGLAWLVGRGNPTRAPQQDWREWLLGGADASLADGLRRWPAGPSVAAAAGAGPGTALGWAIAQP